ncbi:MAG TPA: PEP-CTERM sorting domain-containing protein [Gemmataceae bacterium]
MGVIRIFLLTLSLAAFGTGAASAAMLYGVTGDGASTPESLFTISQTDGSATFFMSLGAGDDGEAIAYNPTDGRMYHWSGLGTFNVDEIFQRIDLGTMAVADITLSGDGYGEVIAAVYDPTSGNFLVNDLTGGFFSVTPGGVVTRLGTPALNVKGLAFAGATLYGIEQFDTFDSDGELDLLTLDPADGSVLSSVDVTLAGIDLNGVSNGLAADPDTGELWGIVQGQGGRRLVTIDPATGVATQIGVLSDNFAGLAFVGTAQVVPEPASVALLGLGAFALVGGAGLRRRARAA